MYTVSIHILYNTYRGRERDTHNHRHAAKIITRLKIWETIHQSKLNKRLVSEIQATWTGRWLELPRSTFFWSVAKRKMVLKVRWTVTKILHTPQSGWLNGKNVNCVGPLKWIIASFLIHTRTVSCHWPGDTKKKLHKENTKHFDGF